jgi:hypothetical protein
VAASAAEQSVISGEKHVDFRAFRTSQMQGVKWAKAKVLTSPEATILLNGGTLPSRGMDSKFGVLIWLNSRRKAGFGLFLA